MWAKILGRAPDFQGLRYNQDKVDLGRAELMAAVNFDALAGFQQPRLQDYLNYLLARTRLNRSIKKPQLHAVISCKGRSHDKHALTGIARKWLQGMGYGNNPYLIVFHKDTPNNHVHIISTRIDKQGQKIPHTFEKLRSYQVLNAVMGVDDQLLLSGVLQKVLAYHFSSRAQFQLVMEKKGYRLKADGAVYHIFKYGNKLAEMPLIRIEQIAAAYRQDQGRILHLRRAIAQYREKFSPEIYPVYDPSVGNKKGRLRGYSSALTEKLLAWMAVQVVFQYKGKEPPHDYALIDHAHKSVYTGKEIMGLTAFIAAEQYEESINRDTAEIPYGSTETEHPYSFTDQNFETAILEHFSLDIARDVDDEAILGRKGQRNAKSRTITR